MALTHLQGTPVNTIGDLPALGTKAPNLSVTKLDLSELTLGDLVGKTILLNIFPPIDTGVCAASARRFDIEAAAYPGVTVVSVSQDLPFALGRFCDAEGIEHVITTSGFRSSFGTDYDVKLADFPTVGLLVRAVVIIGAGGAVKCTELVEDTTQNPDFETVPAPLQSFLSIYPSILGGGCFYDCPPSHVLKSS